MKNLTRKLKILALLACMAGLASGAWAAGPLHLDGNLHDGVLLELNSTAGLHFDQGVLHLSSGALRPATGRTAGAFLKVEGVGLQPGGHYLVLAAGRALVSLTADDSGRVSGQFAVGLDVDGWENLDPSMAQLLARGHARLTAIELGARSKTEGRFTAAKSGHGDHDGDGHQDGNMWMPLCGTDPMIYGEVEVVSQGDYEMMSVFAMGLDPAAEYIVYADGIEIGPLGSDFFGGYFLIAGNSWDADVPIPEELGSVMDISEVQVLSGGTVVLSGDFDQPCDGGDPGDDDDDDDDSIVDSGYIEICGAGDSAGYMNGGELDWIVYADGTQTAFLCASGASAGAAVTVLFDSVEVGNVPADDWGGIWASFSTDPFADEYPLPDTVLPLDELGQVDLVEGGAVFASGVAGEECEWVDPPEPQEMDFTGLCPLDADSTAAGETGWITWDDGVEEFWVYAYGLDAGSDYALVVDGVDLGIHTAGDFGEIDLFYSSLSDDGRRGGYGPMDNGGYGECLPLPEELSPVSSIDMVAFLSGEAAVVQGSFVNDCEIPEPPMPIDEDYTNLCPVDADSFASGETGWLVWDDGVEEFWVYAAGLEVGDAYDLIVDGNDLGSYTAGEWGEIWLYFSSDPGNGYRGNGHGKDGNIGSVLPLPAELSPVSAIDVVALFAGDAVVVQGSFSEGCDLPEPPELIDEDFTELCPAGEDGRQGETAWQIWDDGTESLQVVLYQADAGASYGIRIDGEEYGSFTADDGGMLWVAFSSTPLFDNEIPLPPELQPVSGTDVVEIYDAAGDLVASGSYSDPCGMDWEYENGYTNLCSTEDGIVTGGLGWMMATADSTPVSQMIFVDLWDADPDMSYTLEIDGIEVGQLLSYPWWEGSLGLMIGDGGDVELPNELDPVSGIDSARILDAAGNEVASGSFSNPCGDDEDFGGGNGDGGNDKIMHHQQSNF